MLDLEIINDFAYEHFENIAVSKNGMHFHSRCPLCGDSKKSSRKKRFHLDYNEGNPIWHCFNCNRSGSFLQIYSELNGVSINEAKKELYKYNPQHLTQILSSKKKKKIVNEIEYAYHNYIIDDCINLNSTIDGILQQNYYKELNNFVTKRELLSDFPIFIAYKGDYKGRIIIPIYNKNNIIYFQGRATGTLEPKYKNPTLKKGFVVFNEEKFDRTKYIIVSEGILDAVHVGNQGTTALGCNITDDFIKLLLKHTDKGIIIALDNDKCGIKQSKKLIDNKYSHKFKFFVYPDKYSKMDICELAIKSKIKDMYNFITKNSYNSFEMKTKYIIDRRL